MIGNKLIVMIVAAMGWVSLAMGQSVPPPLEAYGALPVIRYMEVSPNGQYLAWVETERGKGDFVVVSELNTGEIIAGAQIEDFKPWGLNFVNDEYLVISGSSVVDNVGFRDEWEFSSAISLNIQTGRTAELMRNTEGIAPQSGLGDILGLNEKGNRVLMEAFGRTSRNGPTNIYNLYSVDLDSGRGRLMRKGKATTRNHIISPEGKAVGFYEYGQNTNTYTLMGRAPGANSWKVLFEETDAERPVFSIRGLTSDGNGLLLTTQSRQTNGFGAYKIDFEGNLEGPLYHEDDKEIERLIFSRRNELLGVEYTGLKPTYRLFDSKMRQITNKVIELFPEASVTLQSWSNDKRKLIYKIDGPQNPDIFYMFDLDTVSLKVVGNPRPDISPSLIGPVEVVTYTARDGMEISALITTPPSSASSEALPTIMLPHGGPAQYDRLGFHWMAQYFASRGYLVVQPNFRGSSGFGMDFEEAGYGEWGRGAMQHDLSDALATLVEQGRSDPERVCIVGASYGGYAALAGGAFTPDLYQCVVAISGVSDIPKMIADVRQASGRNHWAVSYWKEQTANNAGQDYMKSVSPVYYAKDFASPVLLIHGQDDTVVEIGQSRAMKRALEQAGKSVRMIDQKRADHWMTDEATRIETLREAANFVDAHIGTP